MILCFCTDKFLLHLSVCIEMCHIAIIGLTNDSLIFLDCCIPVVILVIGLCITLDLMMQIFRLLFFDLIQTVQLFQNIIKCQMTIFQMLRQILKPCFIKLRFIRQLYSLYRTIYLCNKLCLDPLCLFTVLCDPVLDIFINLRIKYRLKDIASGLRIRN